jgi:hypothetical protein
MSWHPKRREIDQSGKNCRYRRNQLCTMVFHNEINNILSYGGRQNDIITGR